MTPDEKRAYQRGYAAGQRRKAKVRARERRDAAREAFWQRAFLAALPACIDADGWKQGDKPIVGISDRTALAREFADAAFDLAKHRI